MTGSKNMNAVEHLTQTVIQRIPTEWVMWSGLLATLLLIYLPDIGHGFIKDDFNWIVTSRADNFFDVFALFTTTNDFYRPLVGVSFAINWELFGLQPFGYAVTNFTILVASAVAIRQLCTALGMTKECGWLAAGLWSLNYYGINIALLWISGRTSLLVTLFSLLSATAFVRHHRYQSAAWALLAMLSKEEAVLLPFILLLWAGFSFADVTSRRSIGWSLRSVSVSVFPLFTALAVYMIARTASGGMTPMSAPAAYQFTFHPSSLTGNLLSYLDRAGTLSGGVLFLLALSAVRLPRPNGRQWQWVKLGVVWTLGGLSLAVLLPIRSSLHAIGPSAGAALAGAALITALWDHAGQIARTRMVITGILIVSLILVPVHWARNDKWADWAILSTHVLKQIGPLAATLPAGSVIQVNDDRDHRINLDASFGTLIETAVTAYTGQYLHIWMEPPPIDWQSAGLVRPHQQDITATFILDSPHLIGPADRPTEPDS